MPKKQAAPEKQILFGRPSNTLKMGIVGLPNVGKSSLFNNLANLSVPAENYPFCTIEPNQAQVVVQDARYDKLCDMWQPKSRVCANLEIRDIAGLVRGAAEGEGLGNAFLSHISAVDGIFHVVRIFKEMDVVHTEGDVDPLRDMEVIHHEIIAKDLQHAMNRVEEIEKSLKRKKVRSLEEDRDCLVKVITILQSGKWIRHQGDWSNRDVSILNQYNFLTAKPLVFLVNMSVDDFIAKKNKWLTKIQQWVGEHGGGPIVPFSIKFETDLLQMNPEDKEQYLSEVGQPSMLNRIIRSGYRALELIHFFTCGEDEVRCWTVRKGTKTPQAAGTIHSDMEKGFICAEVYTYNEFVEYESEAAIKAEGKLRQCGKEYEVQDGDVLFIKFN